MNFLLSTLRDWLVTLDAIALQKPILFQNSKTLVKFKKQYQPICMRIIQDVERCNLQPFKIS